MIRAPGLIALLSGCLAGGLLSASPALAQFGPEVEPPPPAPIDDHEASADAQPPDDAEPPAQAPDEASFEQGLAPFGRWADNPDSGRVWVPDGVGADWRPYLEGRWVPTGAGWSFSSTAPWGWAVYHYGRWGYQPDIGWYWTPGFVWSPGWVSWRHGPGYVSWSPLPPSRYHPRGAWPGWVAVPEPHFAHPIRTHALPRESTHRVVNSSRPGHPSEWAPLRGAYGRRGSSAPVARPPVRGHEREGGRH